MHNQVWMAFGLLILVGCGAGTSRSSNPAPGTPGKQTRSENSSSGKITSLLEPGKLVELCKQGQSMWLDKCYDETRIVFQRGVSCKNESGVANDSDTCPEYRAQKASFSLISGAREELLWSLGEKVTPLLQAARFSLDEKREKYLFWKSPLMLDAFSKIPFSSILTSHPDTSKIEDSRLLSVNKIDFRMSYVLRDSVLMGAKIPYGCPSRGKLIIDNIELTLPASVEEFFKTFEHAQGLGGDVDLGDSRVTPEFEKIDDEQCMRDKENVLSYMSIFDQEGWSLPSID